MLVAGMPGLDNCGLNNRCSFILSVLRLKKP